MNWYVKLAVDIIRKHLGPKITLKQNQSLAALIEATVGHWEACLRIRKEPGLSVGHAIYLLIYLDRCCQKLDKTKNYDHTAIVRFFIPCILNATQLNADDDVCPTDWFLVPDPINFPLHKWLEKEESEKASLQELRTWCQEYETTVLLDFPKSKEVTSESPLIQGKPTDTLQESSPLSDDQIQLKINKAVRAKEHTTPTDLPLKQAASFFATPQDAYLAFSAAEDKTIAIEQCQQQALAEGFYLHFDDAAETLEFEDLPDYLTPLQTLIKQLELAEKILQKVIYNKTIFLNDKLRFSKAIESQFKRKYFEIDKDEIADNKKLSAIVPKLTQAKKILSALTEEIYSPSNHDNVATCYAELQSSLITIAKTFEEAGKTVFFKTDHWQKSHEINPFPEILQLLGLTSSPKIADMQAAQAAKQALLDEVEKSQRQNECRLLEKELRRFERSLPQTFATTKKEEAETAKLKRQLTVTSIKNEYDKVKVQLLTHEIRLIALQISHLTKQQQVIKDAIGSLADPAALQIIDGYHLVLSEEEIAKLKNRLSAEEVASLKENLSEQEITKLTSWNESVDASNKLALQKKKEFLAKSLAKLTTEIERLQLKVKEKTAEHQQLSEKISFTKLTLYQEVEKAYEHATKKLHAAIAAQRTNFCSSQIAPFHKILTSIPATFSPPGITTPTLENIFSINTTTISNNEDLYLQKEHVEQLQTFSTEFTAAIAKEKPSWGEKATNNIIATCQKKPALHFIVKGLTKLFGEKYISNAQTKVENYTRLEASSQQLQTKIAEMKQSDYYQVILNQEEKALEQVPFRDPKISNNQKIVKALAATRSFHQARLDTKDPVAKRQKEISKPLKGEVATVLEGEAQQTSQTSPSPA